MCLHLTHMIPTLDYTLDSMGLCWCREGMCLSLRVRMQHAVLNVLSCIDARSCHCCELASAWWAARPGQLLGRLLWRRCGHHSGAAWRRASLVSRTPARSSNGPLLQQGISRVCNTPQIIFSPLLHATRRQLYLYVSLDACMRT